MKVMHFWRREGDRGVHWEIPKNVFCETFTTSQYVS